MITQRIAIYGNWQQLEIIHTFTGQWQVWQNFSILSSVVCEGTLGDCLTYAFKNLVPSVKSGFKFHQRCYMGNSETGQGYIVDYRPNKDDWAVLTNHKDNHEVVSSTAHIAPTMEKAVDWCRFILV